jgi:hypothetical protein
MMTESEKDLKLVGGLGVFNDNENSRLLNNKKAAKVTNRTK